jgi:hypothetical protein
MQEYTASRKSNTIFAECFLVGHSHRVDDTIMMTACGGSSKLAFDIAKSLMKAFQVCKGA